MNKNLYRVIFHKTLGRMVVVAECAKNQGKSRHTVSVSSGSNTQPSSSIFQKSTSILTLSVWTVLASLGFMSSSYTHGQTQIIADKTAPKSEQAVILPTANGLTQVNIQTPSQAGVSKNQYSQFDVGQQGAILNNSRTHVKTQLAGFVEANPYLARGEAKVILNQVNSNNPSQLKGYVEVAGKRAEVVIANPSGIQVDGGGFINAGGAVLSTGQAQFDAQGNITHYHISNGQQGKIQIDGQGLNANGADYTKLISQYNQVNAHVIAGQGDIEVQTGTSLDVSKLGGMYAGKIRLVGTEKGLGVTQATAFNTNNAGIVSAKASLTLDSQGNLVNTGTLASEQQLDLNVNKLSNETGQIIANQADIRLQQDYTHSDAKQIQANALSLSTQGKLTNTQHLTSNDKLVLQAKQIENQGVINSQQTTVTASETIDNLGAKIYGTQLQIDAKTLNNTPISTLNPKKVDFCQVGTGCVLEVIDKETHQQTWLSKEYLDKFEKLKQTEPTQYAEILKKYQFNYYTVDLGKAPIIGARENLKINVATLNNHPNSARKNTFNSDFNGQSLIVSQGDLDITANTVNNIGASIESTGDIRISAQTLNNKNADYETRIVELDKVDETRFHGLNGLNPTQYKPDEITEHTGQGVDGSIRTMHVNGTNLSYKDYARLDYTKTLMGDKTMKSDPSRILSGADIRLNLNDFNTNKSQIIAGNTIQITGRVTNVDSEPTTITPYYHYNPSVITKYVYVIDGGERSVCVGNIAGCKYDITRVLGPTTNTIAPSKGKPYQLNILNIPDGQGINTAVSQDKTVTKNTDVVVPSLNSLNTSGLFQVSDKPNYVIETDPAFANGKIWLGSDFMTNRLGYQADHIHKRLGDGYYEQQLIKDQVLALTGKRYLADYRTDDAQYRALMDNAVTVAKPLNLRVGVALTAEQMAQLTTDIVWLVEQEVTLKDKNGQNYQQKVLVPRVYVRSHLSDLTGTGSLISARNVDLNLAGDLNNQGNIVAHEQLNVRAKNINNQQGGVIQGDFVQLNAQENINNLGATMKADSAMALSAGKDIKNQSTTYHHENHQGQSSGERTGIAQVASIYIGDGTKGKTDAQGKALTTLSINVDGQYIASAGQIHNAGGTTQLNAKQGVDLQAINVGYRSEAIADANNYHKQSEYQDVGSNITGQGDVIVRTQGNISATGTTLSSQQGRVALIANGGNSSIDIQEGRHTQSLETAYRLKERHLVGSTSVQDRYSAQSNSTQSSVIDGKEVLISATQDVNLTAVQAISDEQTIVQAGRDVHIGSAENHHAVNHQHEVTRKGVMGTGGLGVSVGKEKTKQDNTQRTSQHIGSTVGSLTGDTTLIAGENAQIIASTLSSPQGNVTVQGQQVTISSADNHYQHINKTEYEKKGISVSLNVPTIDTVKNTIQAVQRIGDSKNDRVNAMASANGAWKVYQLYDKLNELDGLKNLGTDASVSISYGEQKNTTEQVVTGSTAQASQVMAGGTVNVRASGAGERSTIEIVGSDVVGKQGTHLVAEHDVNILSAEQRHTEQSNNRSQGWNAGANIGKGGVGATLGGNYGKGSGNGEERTHRHSTVGDEQGVTRITGNHLTVKGGQVVGDTVQVDANKLSMQSVQDTATYHGKQQQISGQATIGYGASVNANYNRSKIDADYASVSTQTGIFAGDGGFDIKVKQHTDLTGAVITSSEQAEQAGKNQLQTGTLTVSDINNHSHYDGQSIAIGANVNVSGKTLGQKAPKDGASAQSSGNGKQFNLGQLQVVATENSAGVTGIGIGRDSDSQQSTTKGGIYTSNVIITNKAEQEQLAKTQGQTLEQNIANAKIDISTDDFSQQGAKANGALNNNFDKDQVQKELNVQTEVTKQFGQNAPKAVADFSDNRILTIAQNPNLSAEEKQSEIAKWQEGGVYRVALHTAVGALATGTVEGAVSTGTVATVAPKLDEIQAQLTNKLVENGFKQDTAETIGKLALNLGITSVGASAGLDTSSTAYALNTDINNRQLHPKEIEFINLVTSRYAKENNISEEEAKKNLLRGVLYHIDNDWNKSISTYSDTAEIEKYIHAYTYITKTVDGWNLDTASSIEKNDMIIHAFPLNGDKESYYRRAYNKAFSALPEDYYNRDLFLKDVFSDEEASSAYYKYASVLPNLSIEDMPTIFKNSYGSYLSGLSTGALDTLGDYKDTFSNLWNNGITLDQVTSAISEGAGKAWDLTTNSDSRNALINDIQSKVDDSYNSFQLNALQGNFEKIANDIGQSVGSIATDAGVGAVTGGVGAKVGKELLQGVSRLNKIEFLGSKDGFSLKFNQIGAVGDLKTSHITSHPDNLGIYDPQKFLEYFKNKHGVENVKSTTVVSDPIQTVNSNIDKDIEVLRDSYGGKAVVVKYSDPKTGEIRTANIPYDSRGLPIFDTVAKVTVAIEKPNNWDSRDEKNHLIMSSETRRRTEMQNATLQLRHLINTGAIDKSIFTTQQLTDIGVTGYSNSNKVNAKITGYTWHHNAQSSPNNMQLVPSKIHNDAVKHTGEGSLSEGR